MDTLGKRIRFRREQLRVSQEELADMINTHQKQISRYENSENDPSSQVLKAIAQALNTTPDWLLGFDDTEFTPDEKLLLSLYRAKDTVMRRKLVDIARIV